MNNLDKDKVFISATGMINSVGGNTIMTVAAINAGYSAYTLSDFDDQLDEPITMTSVPQMLLESIKIDIEPGTFYKEQFDHIIKMAMYALYECVQAADETSTIPMILAMPEPELQQHTISLELLTTQLKEQIDPPIELSLTRAFYTGRAAGIHAIEMAFRYLHETEHEFVIVGGSDSYHDIARLDDLEESHRLLSQNKRDGFVPGEGASFLLLTNNPQYALNKNDHIIALHPPGIANEQGHLGSPQPYLGEGLDHAFKLALQGNENPISAVYSSMNGEHHWAKEYGVATLRNKQHFTQEHATIHPADCYGDLGSATGTTLIGLCAMNLLKQSKIGQHLVYASSDSQTRAALRVEKCYYKKDQS